MQNLPDSFINHIRIQVVPDAHKKHYGSYISFDDRPLSPGCIACKTAGWLCVFIGNKCNCSCMHCPNENVNSKEDFSSIYNGSRSGLEDIMSVLRKPYYSGVGISGGEPFLYIDKLCAWVERIKTERPELYVWCYTNGVFADRNSLKRLRRAGLDEIRFDLAADNYSDTVLRNMKYATEEIDNVGIEVPII